MKRTPESGLSTDHLGRDSKLTDFRRAEKLAQFEEYPPCRGKYLNEFYPPRSAVRAVVVRVGAPAALREVRGGHRPGER